MIVAPSHAIPLSEKCPCRNHPNPVLDLTLG
jgi:hypothetical protein